MYMHSYGSFDKEPDGRVSGHVLYINGVRRDGKYTVTHVFGSGRRIKEILTSVALDAEIAKLRATAS